MAEGGGRYGDASVEASEPVLEDGAAPTVHAGATVEGVEGADVDGIGALEHCEGQVGGGLVEVDDVELLLAEDAAHPPVEPGRKGYAGDGASAWDGHTAAEGDEVLLLAVDSRGGERGENLHGVAHVRQPVAQLGDMGGYATGPGEVVRRHQGDLHPVTSRRNVIEFSRSSCRR